LFWRTNFFLQVTIQLIPISATLDQISIDQRAKTFSIKIKFRLKPPQRFVCSLATAESSIRIFVLASLPLTFFCLSSLPF
jgi:hypothetical protein